MSSYKKLYRILKNKFQTKKILLSDVEYVLFMHGIFGAGVDTIDVINDMITLNLIKKENEIYSLI
jgi:hypothetical protein